MILSDLIMPTVSGMALYDWLLNESNELAQSMIFMTGGAFTQRSREFLENISNLRLEKPIDPKNLRALARKIIRKQ